ncbi:MAG TPA: ribonuclease Z [Nitrososphaeraceae archaeon]|nr:ribonuclease Z [Nitrososphaeraceae archaeon]
MADMKIVFLGTSAAIPTEKRCLSSIAVKRGGELLVFDAGEGMQRNFLQAKLGINKKMKIFITHLHIDHCLGLMGFFQTMSLLGRTKKIDIYGESRLREFIHENFRIINIELAYEIVIHVIDKEGVIASEDDYQITCCRATHSIPAFSFCINEHPRPGVFSVEKASKLSIPKGDLYRRLQHGEDVFVDGKLIKSNQIVGPKRKGRKIGISGDTRPSTELKDFFDSCDILIFESTYNHDYQNKAIETFHSTSTEAALLAKESNCSKLILTHFSSRYDDLNILLEEARTIHSNVDLAEDMKTFYIPYTE